jgi:branched-chain amino acid transport system permease protein
VLYVVLYRTRIGLIVRAGIEDQLMVNILGINVTRTFLVVFGLGSMAAGFAGVINSPIVTVNPEMGGLVLVQSFVVIVIGGVGSFWGAVVGGLIAGEILSLTSMVQPAYSQVMLFAAMALVLILRPQGLFGVQGRE